MTSSKANFCDVNCPVIWSDIEQDDGYAQTAPVGSFLKGASPFGALDMAENVWEWVADNFDKDDYEKSPYENPTGPTSGDLQIMRGGSWFGFGNFLRVSVRYVVISNSSSSDGFRCVCTLEP